MTVASNLYASKVYAEHPIASWPLDDDISYISLITEQDRSFTNWSLIDNGTAQDVDDVQGGPFLNSVFTKLTAINSASVVSAYSQNVFNLEDLNQQMNTFTINAYFYSLDIIASCELGYRYIDPGTSQYIEKTTLLENISPQTWNKLEATFNPPNIDSNAQIVFKINFSGGSGPYVVMNGLSVGQWSETTNSDSLGVNVSQIQNQDIQSMLGGSASGTMVQAYGISEQDGYFLAENGRLLAINSGIPMIYGSDNVTRLNSSSALPSVILPGVGVLNESGKYNSYTVEMWLRIENNNYESKRIWGPITSDYGLYVKRGYLSLVIGDSIGSHFVGEWYRPMLVHITLRENQASVLINGEEVISISFDSASIELPPENEDWVGFFCHDYMPIFEIDCVSVLPYIIPASVAKRRFVWGQGVESPETINSAYQGTVAYIDYPYSQYTSNQIYPDVARWDAGYFENMLATNRFLSVPNYSLPTIYLGNKSLQDLYDDSYAILESNHAAFMSFRPNGTWTQPCYYLFDSLNILTEVVRGAWGVFEVESATLAPEPLMHFVNILTNDRFEINIDGLDVSYTFFRNGVEYGTEYIFTVSLDEHFVVGLHLPRLLDSWGPAIGEFFGNPSAIQLYIGGNGTDTFSGYIYRVGFSNQTNLNEIEMHFDEEGFAITSDGDDLNDHLGSYTLLPTKDFNRYFLDIGISSYWEEYFPLSFFAGYVEDVYGEKYYDLDFLQYNIAYPSIVRKNIINQTYSTWTYDELKSQYSTPFIRSYEILSNSFISGYSDYEDLKNNSIPEIEYDFSNSSVRSYITFQKISAGANKPLTDYVTYQTLPETDILDVPSYENIFSTKFEIKDQTIIYPPKNYGINDTAIVLHLDIKINGIKTNPLILRKMSISSKALNKNVFNEIGTRFGPKLFPYSKTGIYYVQNQNNPYATYTGSSPYLYLTKYSGIESLGKREYLLERGISFPINTQQAIDQKIGAIQLWIKYTEDLFPQTGTTLFSLDSLSLDLGFNIAADQNLERGKIYATNLITKENYEDLIFYQDGIKVDYPYLEKNKWTAIGINFRIPIDFSNYTGGINLFQSAIFNDIAFYNSTALQQEQSVVYRRWASVDGTIASPLDWNYWINFSVPYGKWENVLQEAQEVLYGVNPETLYKSYTGTNRQIVDDNKSLIIGDSGILVLSSSIKDINDVVVVSNSPEWATYTRKPV